jgi:hypothetical protein
MPKTKRRTRGRPKGSYKTWPPRKIAGFIWDAQITIEELERDHLATDDLSVANRLKQKFPRKYYQTAEHLRQMLSSKIEYMRKKDIAATDHFNAHVLAHLLGEKKR